MGCAKSSAMNCFVFLWCTCSAVYFVPFEHFFYKRAVLKNKLSSCVHFWMKICTYWPVATTAFELPSPQSNRTTTICFFFFMPQVREGTSNEILGGPRKIIRTMTIDWGKNHSVQFLPATSKSWFWFLVGLFELSQHPSRALIYISSRTTDITRTLSCVVRLTRRSQEHRGEQKRKPWLCVY